MISQARSALDTLLTNAGFNVSAFVPERITPPVAVIEPSSDWVASGEVFGSYRVGFDVTMITQTATNAKASDEIDTMVDDVLEAIGGGAGFYCGAIGAPQSVQANNAEYLGVTFTVYQNTKL